MRAIVVDDEKLSLMRMERILKDIPQITYVAGYKTPDAALEHQEDDAADIAFLDVEMPEMDGLALSNRLMEKDPGLEVIFVTAHDKYALAAYRTNAIGYLLKPVQKEDVVSQICRVQKYRQPAAKPAREVICKVFGTFYVRPVNHLADILKFRTEKSEELIAYLLSQRDKPVSRDTICDTLWPDMEASKATRNFHTTAYNIRHTFNEAGFADVLLRAHESYRLNPAFVRSDLDLFCAEEHPDRIPDNIDALEAAAAIYEGPYLAGKDYLWLIDYQSAYEQRFERLSLLLCRLHMQNRAYEKAHIAAARLLKYIPLSEDGCKKQIDVFLAMGKTEEANAFYEAFRDNFVKEMGFLPSIKLQGL